MVEGYRSEEDFLRDRARAEAEAESRNRAALGAAVSGALARLERSGRKPDCVVEIKKRALFGGAKGRSKLARAEAWLIGAVDLSTGSYASHTMTYALATDGRLYTGYWYPERRALRTSAMNGASKGPFGRRNGHQPLGSEGLVHLLEALI